MDADRRRYCFVFFRVVLWFGFVFYPRTYTKLHEGEITEKIENDAVSCFHDYPAS